MQLICLVKKGKRLSCQLFPQFHDGGGRPARDRRPVSRLIPCFNTKSYCTTMARIGGHGNEAVHTTYGTRVGGDGAA